MTILTNLYRNLVLERKCSNDFDCDEVGDCFYCLSTGICSKFEQNHFDCNMTETGCGDGDACLEGLCLPDYSCQLNNTLVDLHFNLKNCTGASKTGACVAGKKNDVERKL